MTREQKIYFTVCYFLVVATFIYVFSGISGLNLPKYYPEPGGPSMGYYGKVGFTFLLAFPLSLLFYLFLPTLLGVQVFNPDFWRAAAVMALLFGIFFFAAEEWHRWGESLNLEWPVFSLLLILFLLALKLAQDKG